MKKIPTLYKRNHDGDHQVYDEIVPGNRWVMMGEGRVTEKIDGTACLYQEDIWYKRHDRKLIKKTGNYKPAPEDWIACQESPDEQTGHWPGWVPVKEDNPADKWHIEAIEKLSSPPPPNGTYELIGPKVQSNPYGLDSHQLILHGADEIIGAFMTMDFTGIRAYLCLTEIEGVVWHHPDGRMCKIKRRDFGFKWPVESTGD